ncbi:SH3R3 ligase, partial [Polypterus senegalus]|nr:SH3R3 ligase [Polypterus senegalus]
MDESSLLDLLECSVCLERLDTSAKVLPCQHTFCRRCLQSIVSSRSELRCPECRILVDCSVDELPANILLVRLLDGIKQRPHNSSASPPGTVIRDAPAANRSSPVKFFGHLNRHLCKNARRRAAPLTLTGSRGGRLMRFLIPSAQVFHRFDGFRLDRCGSDIYWRKLNGVGTCWHLHTTLDNLIHYVNQLSSLNSASAAFSLLPRSASTERRTEPPSPLLLTAGLIPLP